MILSGIDIRAAEARYRKVIGLGEAQESAQQDGPAATAAYDATTRELKSLQKQPLIRIDDWNEGQLNPNSYNLRLAPNLLVYDTQPKAAAGTRRLVNGQVPLDPKADNPTNGITLTDEGFVLRPGILYLGKTMEYTETWNCVPCIEGRSSLARLGVSMHVTAGFGDVGFMGNWTLEITVVHPTVMYPNMEVCQICYTTVSEDHDNYKGKYLGDTEANASKMHKELSDDRDDSST